MEGKHALQLIGVVDCDGWGNVFGKERLREKKRNDSWKMPWRFPLQLSALYFVVFDVASRDLSHHGTLM